MIVATDSAILVATLVLPQMPDCIVKTAVMLGNNRVNTRQIHRFLKSVAFRLVF